MPDYPFKPIIHRWDVATADVQTAMTDVEFAAIKAAAGVSNRNGLFDTAGAFNALLRFVGQHSTPGNDASALTFKFSVYGAHMAPDGEKIADPILLGSGTVTLGEAYRDGAHPFIPNEGDFTGEKFYKAGMIVMDADEGDEIMSPYVVNNSVADNTSEASLQLYLQGCTHLFVKVDTFAENLGRVDVMIVGQN